MSRTTTLLSFAEEIARKHEISKAGIISVIPVIVDDLPQTLPVLRALCEMLNGRLLNTLDLESLDGPIQATTDPVRR